MPLARLELIATDLSYAQPLVRRFLAAAVGMTRSGEMSRRQLAHAALAVANRMTTDPDVAGSSPYRTDVTLTHGHSGCWEVARS